MGKISSIRRAFIKVDHMTSQDLTDQVIGGLGSGHLLVRADSWLGHHVTFGLPAPRISLSSFCALLELELARIVLSASGLVVEDEVVAVFVVVSRSLRLLFCVMLLLLLVLSMRSVLLSLCGRLLSIQILLSWWWFHVPFSSPRLLHPVSSSLLAFPSQQVMPSEHVLSHI